MRALNTTWKHMRRSPYQALAAILTMFLTFLLSGIFFVTTAASILILQYFESKPQITVFFMEKAGQVEAAVLTKTLEETGKVAMVKYVSKEEALAIYREQNKNDPLLLEMVTADILPASLEVSAKDPKYLKDLEPLIKNSQGVEEVVYQKDVVDALLAWTNAIRTIGGILGGLLVLDSILIIMTVIAMKIALKREEIDILRLLGASRWYIRTPFVLEGGFYGAIGAGIAWLIIALVVLWLRPFLLTFLGIIPVIKMLLLTPASPTFLLSVFGFLGVLLLAGFLLGSFGSLVALSRYLKS